MWATTWGKSMGRNDIGKEKGKAICSVAAEKGRRVYSVGHSGCILCRDRGDEVVEDLIERAE